MKPAPIEIEDQLKLILTGNCADIFNKYGIESKHGALALRPLLTITRQQLVDHLKENQQAVVDYFINQQKLLPHHDALRLWEEGGVYYSAWMDHGKRTAIKEHASLIEAVVENMLVHWGLH